MLQIWHVLTRRRHGRQGASRDFSGAIVTSGQLGYRFTVAGPKVAYFPVDKDRIVTGTT